MKQHYQIKVYVNKEELNRIKQNALDNGFFSVSSYLRSMALNKMFRIESMVSDIHTKLIN